ncbi:MAG: MBL fold metallo-hydrolase [Clostridia bacterium]|nr:MBL fold metallo-hydrolase [Clostridia bacterium]
MRTERLVVGFLKTNCYIVHDGKCAVVIDPGANAQGILDILRENELSLKYIFLTHAHFDHVLAVKPIAEATGAKICASKGERERMRDAEMSGHTMLRNREFIPISADEELSENKDICVGEMTFSVIETPGHTEGSVCIICENSLFSGDTLFFGSCGRCDLAGGNYEDMKSSLKKLYNL